MRPDGSDETIGAKGDTAITDATQSGTLMAFIKGLVKIFADIWDTTNHAIGVTLKTKIQAIVSGSENDNILTMPGRRVDAFDTGVETADATTAVAVKAAVTNKSIYITDIVISGDTAGWVKIQDTDGTVIIRKKYFPANFTWSKSYHTAKKVVNGKGVNVICENAGNLSVDIDGYAI